MVACFIEIKNVVFYGGDREGIVTLALFSYTYKLQFDTIYETDE